jgi:hypothetical protein
MPPALFALVIFDIGSCFLCWLASTAILLFMLLTVAGMTGICHLTQLLAEMGFCFGIQDWNNLSTIRLELLAFINQNQRFFLFVLFYFILF